MKHLVFCFFILSSFCAKAKIDNILMDSIANVIPAAKTTKDIDKANLDSATVNIIQRQMNKLKRDTLQNSSTTGKSQQIYSDYIKYRTQTLNQMQVEIANIRQRYTQQINDFAKNLLLNSN